MLDTSDAPILPSALIAARSNCEEAYMSVVRVNETLRFHINAIVDMETFRKYHGPSPPPSFPAFQLIAEITRRPRYFTAFTISGVDAYKLTRIHVTCVHNAWYYYSKQDIKDMRHPYLEPHTPPPFEAPPLSTTHIETPRNQLEYNTYMPPPRPCQPKTSGVASLLLLDSVLQFDDDVDMAPSSPESTPTSSPYRSPGAPAFFISDAVPRVNAFCIDGEMFQVPGPIKDSPAYEGCVPGYCS